MENPENQDTLPNLETILNAINSLRQETTDAFNGLRQQMNERFDKVEIRLTNVENDVRQIKEMQFVFENEFDRLLALSHKALQLGHENRADVRIMRKEIEAWSADVMNLERKIA